MVFFYSTNAQTPSLDEYEYHFNNLDSLIETRHFNEAIDYTYQNNTPNKTIEALFVFQRSRAFLKQHLDYPTLEEECIATHQYLNTQTDSLSLYLDARILEILGHYNYQNSKIFTSLAYLDSSTGKYQQVEDFNSAIYNLNMIGTIYDYKGDKAKSIQFYKRALNLFAQNPIDSSYYFEILVDLGNLYYNLDQIDKANEYYRKVYNNPSINQYPDTKADVLNNLGNIAQNSKKLREAEYFYSNALKYYRQDGDSALVSSVLHNLAALLEDSSATSSIQLYHNSLRIKTTLGDKDGMANSLFSIARLYYKTGDNKKAQEYSDLALNAASNSTNASTLSDLYRLLSVLSAERNEWKKAYDYSKLHRDLSDSLRLFEQAAAIDKVEQVYHIEEQNEIIDSLEKSELQKQVQLRKSKVINYALGGATILLIIVLILLMSNFQQMQRTKSTLYTKNLEITAAEALMKGQEDERQRLAHQLHDKVGNHITVLKNHVVTHSGNDSTLLKIVQEMSAEVRNISQDLMPPVLERFGLADALEELCARYRDQMEATIDLNINQSDAMPILRDDQINLYRLIQELIQVSLFQYNANYMLIDMKWNENGIWVDIEDNGTRKSRSLDTDIVFQPWQAIEHRVQFLKGEFKRTSQNHGNEYHIFIPKQPS